MAQRGQAFIAIVIVGVLILGLLSYFFIFARRGDKVEKGALTAPVLTVKSDKSDKIKLLGNQAEPHTILVGNKKGIRFFDESYGELMRITADGKVGIGTPSPTEKLTVNGNLVVSGAIYGSAICLAGDCKSAWPTGAESYWALAEENVYNLNPGNVGIGTQSPTEKLEVAGKIKATGICIGTDCRTSWPTGGAPVTGSLSWSNLTNFPPACPAGQFVRKIGRTLECATPAGLTGGGIGGSGTAKYLAKWTGSSTLGNSIIFDTGTNVGIGITTPGQKLEVNGIAQAAVFYASTGISTFDAVVSAGTIEASRFCLGNGTNCITSWPTGGAGSGDITAVLAGAGLSGGGTSGDVTLSADTNYLQRRVSSTCPTGSAIRVVAADGTVTCESVGGGGGGGNVSGSGTAGYLARWLGTNTVGNSAIFQTGVSPNIRIGIGTDNPGQTLEVSGVAQAAVFYASTGISTFDVVVSAGTIEASQFCLGNGTNCITSWPAPGPGGGGTITQIDQGAGITLSPNPITTTGTISLATQNCPANKFVTGIGGTITCATAPATGGGVSGSGTVGRIPIWTGTDPSTALANSIIYQATATNNIGIDAPSPVYKLDISGDVRWTGTLQGGFVPWARLTSFPSACTGNDFVKGIDTGGLTCSTPAGAGGGAPTDASYVVMGLNASLSAERRLVASSGISLLDSGANTNVTLSADTSYLQRRVTGTCDPGFSIRVISSTGSVTCEPDDVGAAGTLSCTSEFGDLGAKGETIMVNCQSGYTPTGWGADGIDIMVRLGSVNCNFQNAGAASSVRVYCRCCRVQ